MAPAPAARGLRVNNSLSSGEKVCFETSDGSNHVTWYICGPTVYDSSHVGHARNYMSFDIIRRILEDFFGYDVFYVMNVTDVDDKIINRARRDHLLAKYIEEATEPSQVLKYLKTAFSEEIRKQKDKITFAEEEHAKAKASQQKELDDKIRQEKLKLQKLEQAENDVTGKSEEAHSIGGKAGVSLLLAGDAADVLASQLDSEHGDKVTDHAIFRSHAAKYEKEFLDDMESLGIKPPTVLTRVTEYIDKIIEYVKTIIANGFAYEAHGSVYFDTNAFVSKHKYGKLNPSAVGSLGLSSESESNFDTRDKKNSCDFALWKASKSGEPFWESPWGRGRPGWHIECSAMASDIIGETIDIHTGGVDLKFPHHDNELAQAEAYHGCFQWVNYFLHSGHLSIDGLKMSKSLKNFITIKQALEKYTARQLRLLFVLHQWDKPMDFSESAMNEAIEKEKQFRNFFKIVKDILRKEATAFEVQSFGEKERALYALLRRTKTKVRSRLEDNFNTPKAVKSLLKLVSGVHSYLQELKPGGENPRGTLLREVANYITRILQVFGLSARFDDIGFGSESATATDKEALIRPFVDALCDFRYRIRDAGKGNEKIMELSDDLRERVLVDLGVRLEDRAGSYVWEYVDVGTLQRERDEKLRNLAEAKRKKLEGKRDRLVKELEKLDAASVPPSEYFKNQGKYSAFDNEGVPTHAADGKELSKGARKDVEKLHKKLKNEHEKLLVKLQGDSQLLQNLRREVEDIDREIRSLSQTS